MNTNPFLVMLAFALFIVLAAIVVFLTLQFSFAFIAAKFSLSEMALPTGASALPTSPPVQYTTTPIPTPTPVSMQTAVAETPTPGILVSPYEPPQLGIPANFISVWNMASLSFPAGVPASLFPVPPEKVSQTSDSLFTLDGKPAVLLFTTRYCRRCAWERQAFYDATSKFGTWKNLHTSTITYNLTDGSTATNDYLNLADASFTSPYLSVRAIEVDEAPFLYQPVFMRYSPTSEVPLIVFGGTYFRLGSNEVQGVSDEENRAEETARLTAAVCGLLSKGALPSACTS